MKKRKKKHILLVVIFRKGVFILAALFSYLKNNIDLTGAAIFAVIMTSLVPFSPASLINSINLPLLILLFCLMTIVAGLKKSGLLTASYSLIFSQKTSSRTLSRFFIFSCFFSSMFITNDVALIIFVPLSITLLTQTHLFGLFVPVIVLETIAANLGSMLTPIGNPQNLFIFSHYNYSLGNFLLTTCPVTLVSGILIFAATRLIKEKTVQLPKAGQISGTPIYIGILLILFCLCLLAVLRIVPVMILPIIIVPIIGCLDKQLFKEVDVKLLLLFIFLFIGVGSLSRLPFMQTAPAELLAGHEFLISLLLSQFVSNVPATVMLAQYTNEADALLLGVNIGGLGTIIASMASVISFKAYHEIRHSSSGYYLSAFSIANGVFLIILLIFHWLYSK